MNKRSLGKTGLAIAPIAFGGNVLGWTTSASQILDIPAHPFSLKSAGLPR